MKKILILTVVCNLLFSFNAKALSSFIEGMEDVPIPDKMMQIQADNFSFGNEETRLVEAYLQSNFGKFSFVTGFYESTLPQLGWELTQSDSESLTFIRNNEELNITLTSKMPLIVRVTLTGRP